MTIRYAFRQTTNYCNRYNCTAGYRTSGSLLGYDVMHGDVGDNTTPHKLRQSTVINGVHPGRQYFDIVAKTNK